MHFIASKRERKTSIHLAKIRQLKGEDLKEYVQKFNDEVMLIPNLLDGIPYITFLNGLLPHRFKFSLAASKVTTMADALRRAQDFIQVTGICVGDEFNHQESQKRLGEDRDAQLDTCPKRNEERRRRFHTSP